jgi:pimeloyl-ACP methyl ester carboxylesterase
METSPMSDAKPSPHPLVPATYTEQRIEIAGLKLRLQDYGTAGKPAMLCLHGGAANAHWYDFVAEGFTADYHVRALDFRGHGDSDWDACDPPDYTYRRHAADVHELTQKLDLRDFVLIAHSMGGMVSSIYAATYPGRLKALIIVDSNLTMTPERIANYRVVGNREGRQFASQEEFVAAYKVRPGGSTAQPEVLRHIALHSGRVFDDGLWRHKVDRKVYADRELVDSYPLWNQIRIPALLMRAALNKRMTPEAIAQVQSRAPQVQVTVVPDSDHHITLDNPAGFIQAARRFLDPLA